MSVINIADKFSQFDDHWSPRVVTELNGQAVKLAKVSGTFVWHDHTDEDELFLVFRGMLHIDFPDCETVTLREGELFVVPRGTTHRPRTPEGQETWIMLLEPIQTKHTGDVQHALTVTEYKRI